MTGVRQPAGPLPRTAPLSARKILVTGATGFVGRALVTRLLAEGRTVRAAARSLPADLRADVEQVAIGEIGPDTDWTRAVIGIEAIVHLAARAHMTGEDASTAASLFRAVNATGSAALARAARKADVRRIVLISTTTVYGDRSPGRPFDESSRPAPATPYAGSKLEAERLVAEALAGSATELVVLRPPLVYGPGAKGNFARLVGLVQRSVPLPLASVHNRRSVVYVENLVDAILRSIDHPAAAGRTYVVSDGRTFRRPTSPRGSPLRWANGRACSPSRRPCCGSAGKLTGHSDEVSRLLDDMAVDSSLIRAELGWKPPFSLAEGLRRSVAPGERR